MKKYLSRILVIILTVFSINNNYIFDNKVKAEETIWSFSYEEIGNSYATWICPKDGVYTFEAWGASGGGARESDMAGSGGYTKTTLNCFKDDTYYIYCGEKGFLDNIQFSNYDATYNGGGATVYGDNSRIEDGINVSADIIWNNGSGGGATDFRTVAGLWNDTTSVNSRVLVAGGGGGLYWDTTPAKTSPSIENNYLEYTKGNSSFSLNSNEIGTNSFNPGNTPTPENHFLNYYGPSGGGGYFGGTGFAIDRPWLAASGGGGFYDTNMLTGSIIPGGNIGHGKAKITYNSQIKSRISFNCTKDINTNSIGYIEGLTPDLNGICYDDNLIYSSSYTIPKANKNGWEFLYWTDINDETKKYYEGDIYTIGVNDLYLIAHYKYDGNAKFYAKEKFDEETGKVNHFIHVNNIDDGIEKSIKFYSSEDGGNTYKNVNTNGVEFDSALAYKEYNAGTINEIYNIKSKGNYELYTAGGIGSNGSISDSVYCDCCGTYHNGRAGTGIKGTTLKAHTQLNYGDILHINVGTNAVNGVAGSNGGGNSWSGNYYINRFGGHNGWNGGFFERYWNSRTSGSAYDYVTGRTITCYGQTGAGGGASDIRLNSTELNKMLIAAGGGGGGSTVSGAYYGDSVGTITVNANAVNSNSVRLYGNNGSKGKDGRRLYGGGGGGYFGGTNASTGYPSVANLNRPITIISSFIGTSSTPMAYIKYLDTDTKILSIDADFKIDPYDTLAPNKPNDYGSKYENDILTINWNDCEDNGNNYLYKAELWRVEPEEKLYDCEDLNTGNETININSKSGTKGYYYVYSETDNLLTELRDIIKPKLDNGEVATGTGIIPSNEICYTSYNKPNFDTLLSTKDTFLYVCAIDYAGNISDTTKFVIPYADLVPPEITIIYKNIEDNTNPNTNLYIENKIEHNSSYIIDTWTSKTVEMNINIKDGLSGVKKVIIDDDTYINNPILKSFNLKINKKDTNEYTGLITAQDDASTFGTGSFEDNILTKVYGKIKIDKTKPTGSVLYNINNAWYVDGIKPTNKNVLVKITANDIHSGLHDKSYSWDDGNTWTNENIKEFTKNIDSYVLVRDKVGNYIKIPIKITGIDKVDPIIHPTYDPKETDENPLPKDYDNPTEYNYPIETNYTYKTIGNLIYDWVNVDVDIDFTTHDEEDILNGYSSSGIKRVELFEANSSFDKGNSLKQVLNSNTLSYTNTKQGITYFVIETEDNAENITILNLTVKIDKTAPIIPEERLLQDDFYIEDIDINKYGINEVENKIKDSIAMKRSFSFKTTDYNNIDFGPMTSEDDSSGISEFILTLIDADNSSIYKDYNFGYIESRTLNTLEYISFSDIYSILSSYFVNEIDTFAEFPNASALKYKITIKDRAGNETIYYNLPGNEIKNFSIKAIIKYAPVKEEDIMHNMNIFNSLNISNLDTNNKETNIPYFKTGDYGYIEAWTIGYVPTIQFDFDYIGEEMTNEIKYNKVSEKYNLGIDTDTNYIRKINYSQGTEIPTIYSKIDGIPYATHYGTYEKESINNKNIINYNNCFQTNGSAIRIPPYYSLEKDIIKKVDKRDDFKSEVHTASIKAIKGLGAYTIESKALYVIYDEGRTDLHFRITHE